MGDITPNVSVTYGELGTPTFIRSTTAFLSRRSTAAPLDIAAAFVNDNPALFGVPFPAASDYRSLRNYVTPSLGVRHITLQQRHGGQDVFGGLLTVNITTDGMLVNIGSSFLPMPAGLTGAPACGARNAIAAACDAMDDDRLEDLLALVPEATACTTNWASGHSVGVGSSVGGTLSTPEFELPPGETAIIEHRLWFFDRNPSPTANQPGAEDVECVVDWLRGGEVRASWATTPASAALRWQRHRLTIGTSDGSGPARIRFRFQDLGLDSVVEGGIDDVLVRCTTGCEECRAADVNIDGNVDQDDVAALIGYNAGAGCP